MTTQQDYAKALYDALQSRTTIAPISKEQPTFTIDDAYQISLKFLALRKDNGERVIGKKIGVTSKPVQEMLNVHQPDFGFLTDSMHYANGASVSFAEAKLTQPRAEAEIAFYLNADLKGPGITKEDVLAATEWVAPCFEIVDSRINDWQINIVDTVADNASCGVFVISDERCDPKTLDLASAKMHMWHNGQPAGEGLGSAVQGHPAEAVAWLANTLGEYGISLNRGDIILSGALAPLVSAAPGDKFTMSIADMGECSIQFTD